MLWKICQNNVILIYLLNLFYNLLLFMTKFKIRDFIFNVKMKVLFLRILVAISIQINSPIISKLQLKFFLHISLYVFLMSFLLFANVNVSGVIYIKKLF